jgi:hypothetical protein
MSTDLDDSNVIQRLILSLKFKSETLKQAILNYLLKMNEVEKFEFFMSDVWHEFSLECNDMAKAFMKEFYMKIQ